MHKIFIFKFMYILYVGTSHIYFKFINFFFYFVLFFFIFILFIFFFMYILWILYDPTQVIFYTVVPLKFSSYYIYIGIDGISLFFMYLTSFLTPLCILYCMGSSKYTRLE